MENETQSTVSVLVGAGLVFRSVSAGLAHTCGVTTDSVAYCWGLNSSGQLGIATTFNADGPERVSGT
jgi:alpha-tubulin suppressor-like RCC1 family protein